MKRVEIDLALARATLYEVLKIGLYPPAPGSLGLLSDGEAGEALRRAAGAVEEEGAGVRAALEELLQAGAPCRGEGPPACEAGETQAADLDLDYQRVFGHTARGKVPPYETEYGPDEIFRQSQELADLNGFYRAFGLNLAPDSHQRSDHLGVEFEFLSFLCRKEAFHLLSGDPSPAEEVRKAERLFLRDHAGRFGQAFGRALAREAGHPVYRALGNLCSSFLDVECLRLGVAPGPDFVRLRSTEEPAVPMACGGCKLLELAGEPLREGPPG